MKFIVTGMSCAACSARVDKAVRSVDGVDDCAVNLLTGTLTVTGDADANVIISAVKRAGYDAEVVSGQPVIRNNQLKPLLVQLALSVVISLVLMYFTMGHNMLCLPVPRLFDENILAAGMLQMILALAVIIINNSYFINGFKGVLHLSPNMDTLVSLGSAVSFLWSCYLLFRTALSDTRGLYFESAAMILAFIDIGKTLEAYSKGRTGDAIKALMSLKPQTAVVERDGEEVIIDADSIVVGDIFIVCSGASIPADGTVLEGTGAVNESALTGESIPCDKKLGDSVFAATVCASGFLRCKATGVGQDTSFARIIQTVADASSGKAPIARLADKVSGVFVPAVLFIAAVTFVIWLVTGVGIGFALERGIAVLVISCPCALGLATPVAITVGSGVGARYGVLFRTASALEEAGRIKTVVLDKTGTVTTGKAEVCGIYGEKELLEYAYSLEKKSEHPLAKAIVKKCEAEGITLLENTDFEVCAGSGVKAVINGDIILGGNAQFVNVIPDTELARLGQTPVYFTKNGKLLGIISIADTVKKDSREAVEKLKKMGINVIMLTGDNSLTARAVAEQVGIGEVIADVMPQDKASVIRELSKKGKVAMVGDGINDAPALVEADCGFALGTGTDIAIDSADVLLTGSSLDEVCRAVFLGRKVLKNIKENLFWAFAYNCIGIPLAAGAFVWAEITMSPMLGALAMSLSSFCVVSNALRLNLIKFNKESKKMKKVIKIGGMMCGHCEARVKKLLEAFPQVEEAEVSHEKGTAVLTLNSDISDADLKKAIEDDGYTFGG